LGGLSWSNFFEVYLEGERINRMKHKRYHVYISGRVQGVCFRANALSAARSLGVTGWVRNLPDGRVETVFEGEHNNAEAMLAWCQTGTPPARVDHVDVTEEKVDGCFTGFDIVYYYAGNQTDETSCRT
jgi:acylphosphatase